jgi:alkanesulfonate monooxygenase SsuD/methylene tetrahydromethanopterin reductase-like flavin-dependent oxidoreductase (luciferase family)
VFQNFATLDLFSQGRAEMVVGRGSFIESYPLFGLKLEDYDSLFEEKLDLLLKIRDNEHVRCSGKHRAPLSGQSFTPDPRTEPFADMAGRRRDSEMVRSRRRVGTSVNGCHHRR